MKRKNIFLFLALSLLGVFVTSIATMAWFQATINQGAFDGMNVTTGSISNIEIDDPGVKGYKYTYDELNADDVGTEGTVTGQSALGNIDQDDVNPLDPPKEGVGFYILGDADWAIDHGGTSADAFKFSTAVKMQDKHKDDYAAIQLTLAAETELKFVEHTYHDGRTVKYYYDTVNSFSSTKAHKKNDGSMKVIIDIAGTYDIIINNRKELCFNTVTPPSGSLARKERIMPKKALPSATDYIRFENCSAVNWNAAGAYISGYFFGWADHDPVWTTPIGWTSTGSNAYDSYADIQIPTGNYTSVIFVRLKSATTGWDNKHNQTVNLTLTGNQGKKYVCNTWNYWDDNQNKCSGSWSVISGYYLVGIDSSNSYFGTSTENDGLSWTWKSGKRFTEVADSGYLASAHDVLIPSGVKFKIAYVDSSGAIGNDCWYGYGSCNDSSAINSTGDNSDSVTAKQILCDLHLSDGYRVVVSVKSYSVTFKYKRYPHNDVSWNTSPVDDEWLTFGSVLTPYYGGSITTTEFTLDGYTGFDYWYSADDFSGSKTAKDVTVSNVTSNLVYYGRCKESPFNLTVKIVYTTPASLTSNNDDSGSTDTIAIGPSTDVTPAFINANLTSGFKNNIDSDFGEYGYYTTLTGDLDNGGVFSNALVSENYSSAKTIYLVCQPKTCEVTYKYRYYTKNSPSASATSFVPTTPLSDDSPRAAYYTATYVPARPTHESFVAIDSYGAYYFAWDEKFYNEDGTEYTNAILKTDTDIYIHLTAVYERIYVSIHSVDSDWISPNVPQLHVITSVNSGTNDFNIPNTGDANDCYYFRISSSNIEFQIRSSYETDDRDRYTPNIVSTTQNDCSRKGRGTYSDTIEITNDITGEYYRYWRWSVYYGDTGKEAKLFASGDANSPYSMYRGDGYNNMYTNDSCFEVSNEDVENEKEFAVRFKNGSQYIWYGFDDLDNISKTFVQSSETPNSTLGDANSTCSSLNTIVFKEAGTFNWYLTSSGKLSIADVPSKGEGYYIMPFDSTGANGNTNTSTYLNCVKMRKIVESGTSNLAVYKYFRVDSLRTFYFKSYVDGVDNGNYTTLSNTVNATLETVTISAVNYQVIQFRAAGNYHIYITTDRQIHIEVASDNFYTLNTMGSYSGSNIKEANTTLVLEIPFHCEDNNQPLEIGVNVMREDGALGLSNYTVFAAYCSSACLGKDSWAYMRNNCYDDAVSFESGQTKLSVFDTNNTINDDDTHYLYLMIDYDRVLSSAEQKLLFNDFYLLLTARK